ncbi:unnamed protein product, partial [Owenia fusiformis]
NNSIQHSHISYKQTINMSWVQATLIENSTKKFYIEHTSGRTNHIAHGIIALDELGADKTRIQKYIHHYAERLEKPRDHEDAWEKVDIENSKGKQKGFYGLLDHYKELLQEVHSGDWSSLLTQEFPKLSAGVVGAATHGLIQIGYGVAAKSDQVICEGLAYLHHSYLAIKTNVRPINEPKLPITEVLQNIYEDKDFQQRVNEEAEKDHPFVPQNSGNFTSRILTIYNIFGDKLLQYSHQVQMPSFFNEDDYTLNDVVKLARWIVDCAILVFAKSSRKNDFFLLHGVTAAWSLLQIIPLLSPENGVKAIKEFLIALLGVYIVQKCPALTQEIPQNISIKWDELIKKTIDKDVSRDTHKFKLVQACYDMYKTKDENGDGYSDNDQLYFFAAKMCVENVIKFVEPEFVISDDEV